MKKRWTALALGVALLLAMAPAAVFAQGPAEPAYEASLEDGRYVTRVRVTGNAEVTTDANRAIVRSSVEATGETAVEAQEQAGTIYKNVTDILRQENVEFEAGHYSLHPRWEHRPNEGAVQVGYEAQRELTVKIDDLDRVGGLITSLLRAGVRAIWSVDYTVTETDALREQALTSALADARKQAEWVADALGLSIIAVEDVTVGSSGSVPALRAAMAESFAVDMDPSPVNVRASVSVTYVLGK